jgi:hypothetical protein
MHPVVGVLRVTVPVVVPPLSGIEAAASTSDNDAVSSSITVICAVPETNTLAEAVSVDT